MKFTHREPQAKRQPRTKASEALLLEAPPAAELFDPKEFRNSPVMRQLRADVSVRAGDVVISTELISSYWLARLDPEYLADIQKHAADLKGYFETNFQRNQTVIDDSKDQKTIAEWTLHQHAELITALQTLYTPNEKDQLLRELDLNLDQQLELPKEDTFLIRILFAHFLIYEHPKQRQKILSTLFEELAQDPKGLADKIRESTDLSQTLLPVVLDTFPELRQLLDPEIQKQLAMVRVEYAKEQQNSRTDELARARFVEAAHQFALLSAERTWIDENGLLHFEFKPTRLAKTAVPLPDRSTH